MELFRFAAAGDTATLLKRLASIQPVERQRRLKDVVELLTNGSLPGSIRNELARRDESLLVPHLIDVEVMGALRRLAAGQRIDSSPQRAISRSARYFAGGAVFAHTID